MISANTERINQPVLPLGAAAWAKDRPGWSY